MQNVYLIVASPRRERLTGVKEWWVCGGLQNLRLKWKECGRTHFWLRFWNMKKRLKKIVLIRYQDDIVQTGFLSLHRHVHSQPSPVLY